jgi:hypothetical protein
VLGAGWIWQVPEEGDRWVPRHGLSPPIELVYSCAAAVPHHSPDVVNEAVSACQIVVQTSEKRCCKCVAYRWRLRVLDELHRQFLVVRGTTKQPVQPVEVGQVHTAEALGQRPYGVVLKEGWVFLDRALERLDPLQTRRTVIFGVGH